MSHAERPACILWRRVDQPGHEYAELRREGAGWSLRGWVVVAESGRPCHAEYAVTCDAAWQTTRAAITGAVAGAPFTLELARSDDDRWTVNGEERPELAGCVDVDLAFTPSTNLLPIRRLTLGVGAHADVRVTWLRFPELTVEVLAQRYTRTGPDGYRFETADGTFARELRVNDLGFPVDYPGLWRREA